MKLAKSTVLKYIGCVCLLLSFVFGIITLIFVILHFAFEHLLLSSIGSTSYFILFIIIHLWARYQSDKEDLEIIKQLDEEIRRIDKTKN